MVAAAAVVQRQALESDVAQLTAAREEEAQAAEAERVALELQARKAREVCKARKARNPYAGAWEPMAPHAAPRKNEGLCCSDNFFGGWG